ncbi:hypothetical protein [Streptomyces sp. NPDC059071]|uniref:hypothetical protein n=1 Tax=unclassified Streptomyces TaxID=2593676 RepID=UPI003666D481
MAPATEAPATTTAEGPTQHVPNQLDALAQLRVPFPAEQVHYLPKILCKACSDSRTKVCDNPNHQKAKCRDCDNFITTAHIHLDYVGHAELTNRLLDVDPLWEWEPLALDQRGLPQFDENGGLWIRLTVCSKTRLGYGDSQGKRGPNAVKEAIGDALRNAAMRFGAALDLWAKSDLTAAQAEHPKSEEDDGRPALFDKLVAQVPRCWDNPLALTQIHVQVTENGLGNRDVQGPPPELSWTTFDALLSDRITELNKRTVQGGAEGSAA